MLLCLDSSILCMCQVVSTYAWQALDPGRHWNQVLFCLQTSPVALELILLSPGCSPQTHEWPVLPTTERWIRCFEIGLKELFLELALRFRIEQPHISHLIQNQTQNSPFVTYS